MVSKRLSSFLHNTSLTVPRPQPVSEPLNAEVKITPPEIFLHFFYHNLKQVVQIKYIEGFILGKLNYRSRMLW